MASLVMFLNRDKGVLASMAGVKKPEFLPSLPNKYFQPFHKKEASCVVRDMRDSSITEMQKLKEIGTVIAIDDCGPGSGTADVCIDLLPNPARHNYNTKSFIYGFNFTESVRQLKKPRIAKSIDAILYCGYNPAAETIDFFRSLIPEHTICALLLGNNSRMIADGKETVLNRPYAETILSAKLLISHFGIALYEGHIAGCRLACVNPTEYHSRLADIAKNDIGLLNLGVLKTIDPVHAQEKIVDMIQNPLIDRIHPEEVLEKIEGRLENFFSDISPHLGL